MNSKNISFMALAAFLLLQSCIIDEPYVEQETSQMTIGAYVLNSGNWGGNDACITMVNTLTSTLYSDAFYKANSKRLGDNGQDIMTYGNNVFISVSGSGTIFAVDKYSCEIKAEIKAEVEAGAGLLSPRYLAACDGSVYVSYYEGYVGKIDTVSMTLKDCVKVGDNPEGIAIAAGKLYVANSGGMAYPNYGKTVSVIDLQSFEVTRTLEVALNPNVMKASGDCVYLISWGNYEDTPAVLQKIDGNTDIVTSITAVSDPYQMEAGPSGELFIVTNGKDNSYNPAQDIVVYDAKKEELEGRFISDGFGLSGIYSVSVDPVTGYVYVGTSDYVSTGMIYVFSKTGLGLTSFSSGGYNPIKVAFVSNI